MRRLFFYTVFLFLPFSSSLFAQLSGSFSVGSGGDYPTFTAAVNAISSQGVNGAVTFNVISGSYNEQIQIQSVSGTSASNTITFQSQSGNPADVEVAFSATTSGDNFLVKLDGTSYITFRNMTFTATGSAYGTLFNFSGTPHHVTLDNNIMNGYNQGSGSSNHILIYSGNNGAHNITIKDNVFNYGSYGIYLVGTNNSNLSSSNIIQGNTFNNTVSYGLQVLYQDAIKIHNNVINTSPTYGIYLQSCHNEVEITANSIRGTSYGLYYYASDGNTARGLVANNFIYNTGNSGNALYMYSVSNQDIYHNSVVHLYGSVNTSTLYAYAGSGSSLQNNNLIHNSSGYAIDIYTPASISSADYNNLFSTGNYLAKWDNTDQYDLEDYRNASGKEVHSISVYPNFTNVSSDLHSSSPWLNAMGTALNRVTTDFDGETRNGSTPDIGADEFTPAAGTTTPLAGTYTIGGAAPDYVNVAEAVDDLLLKGISDSVSLEIRDGSYNVNQLLYTIPGSSEEKPVVFRSASGNRANITLFHEAAGQSDNYVFYLKGADFYRFHNMTLSANTANNASYATVFNLFGGVDHLHVKECAINGSNTSHTNGALFYAYQSVGTYRLIKDNHFDSGSYGIYQYGYNTNQPNRGAMIIGNSFSNQNSYAGYFVHDYDLKLRNNSVNTSPNYGFYLQSCHEELEVTGNRVRGTSYGIYLYASNGGTGLETERGLIANNFIFNTGSGGYGFYLYSVTNQDIYHNNIVHLYGNINTAALYVYAGSGINLQNNNIIHNELGVAVDIYTPASLNISDYNNLFSSGLNLGKWNNNVEYNLADYQAASGKEAHSVSYYPAFTNFSTDLHSASPWLDGAGVALSRVMTDIDGEARNGSTPDIGADEFTPAGGTTTPLAGSYTIGGSSPDYTSVADAVDDLLIKGVSDSVSMEIRNGSYDVSQMLYTIPGSAPDKPVSFRSQSGNPDDVTLFHEAAGQSDNYIFYLKGADFIRLLDLTLAANSADNASYAIVVNLFGGVDQFHLEGCQINGSSSSNTNASLLYAYQTLGRSRLIRNNQFNFGSYGIYQYGYNSTQPNSGAIIENNTFSNQRSYAGYFVHDFNLKLVGNSLTTSPNYGFYLQSCDEELEIRNNHLRGTSYPLYIYACTGGTGAAKQRGLIANNFIFNTSTGGYGLYVYSVTNQDIYHNSVLHLYGNSNTSAIYLYAGDGINILNNNFVHNAYGYAMDIYTPSAVDNVDYNNLFSTGNYLGRWNNTAQYSLEDYKTASGKESHSISVYPRFASLSDDLHSDSPWLDGAGTPLSRVATDFDGEFRNESTPDIGADEYTPAPGSTVPLAGTYTIGGSAPDYAGIDDAIEDLLLKGVSDSVFMEIRDGSYNINEMLYTVPGSAMDKPVVFRSESGDPDKVDLWHVATGQSDNFIFDLRGADYVHFRDLSLSANVADNASYATVFNLYGGVDYFHLQGCKVNGSYSSVTGAALLYAYNSVGTYRMIKDNQFNKGSYAIYQHGVNTTQPNRGAMIIGNELNNQRSYGGYMIHDFDLKIMNNRVSGSPNYGLYLQSCNDELEINGNIIKGSTYGLYLYACNGGTGQAVERGLVANNFIINTGGGGSALYTYNSTNLDIYHNSALNLTGHANSSAFYIYVGTGNNVVNNIFMHKGAGFAYQVGSSTAIGLSDYNDLYTYGDYVGYWNGNLATLADFRSAGNTDANSISTNPGFFSNDDLHAYSALVDSAGMPLSRVLYDIDGDLRSASHPDIGADEFDSTGVVSIDDDLLARRIPKQFRVYDNYPNPFNPATTIRYDLPEAAHVRLRVYNILGQVVATLVDNRQNAGAYHHVFDASKLSSGLYFYRLEAGKNQAIRKMVLSK